MPFPTDSARPTQSRNTSCVVHTTAAITAEHSALYHDKNVILHVRSSSCDSSVDAVFGYPPPDNAAVSEMVKFLARLREPAKRCAIQIGKDEVQRVFW